MAKPEDIASFSIGMRTAYGALWKNDSVEALQVWTNALARYNFQQIAVAMQKCLGIYINYPPTLPQFLQVISEPVPLLPGSAEADNAAGEKILAYAKPVAPHNPDGNPHGVILSNSVASRRQSESIGEYDRRISDAVTSAKYPILLASGDS